MVKQRKQIPKGPPDSEETSRPLPSVSTSAVFSFLKDTRGALTWKMQDFQDCLKIGAKDAKHILEILRMQGYIQQKDDTDEYLTTASGETVSRSKLPQMKRESVEEALSTSTDIERLRNEGPATLLVSVADKLYNARAILEEYRQIGAEVWTRFKRGREQQLWYFDELIKVFEQKCPNWRIVQEFKRLATELSQISAEEE